MARSSALRKEATAPAPTPITITHANSVYTPRPKDASIANDGSVTFNAPRACWVHTSPTGVFGDAQGIIKLSQGNNGPYSPQQSNVTVVYGITDPQMPRPTMGKVGNGGNTIKVG